MCISLASVKLWNISQHCLSIYVFLTAARGASTVRSPTLITRTRCATVWHKHRIRVGKSLSYLSESLGGVNTFHKGQPFSQISGPSIILTLTLSSFCLACTFSPLSHLTSPYPLCFPVLVFFRFFHLCFASPSSHPRRLCALNWHLSSLPSNQLVGAAWVLQAPTGHVVARPAAATADAGAAPGARAAGAAEAAGRAVSADQRGPDAHR